MSIQVETSATGSHIPLRGVERMLTAFDGASVKIAHSMLVRVDTALLLRFLPIAVINTFDMHPRMRALQLKIPHFTAEVQAPITINTLTNLLHVRILTPADYGDGSPTSWQAFVEKECSVSFDRYRQLPFYLHVWIAKRKGTARLMLFSDQYMSDGFSGVVVLNCILENISRLARQTSQGHQNTTTLTMKELPLRPSLYRMWLGKVTWIKPLLKGKNAIFGHRIFRSSAQKFKPLLLARKDQKDFAIPPVANSTKALFADGDNKCMLKALRRCKEESVSLNGAVIVLALLVFYRVRRDKEHRGRFYPFKIAMNVDCNMRNQVPCPAEENHVGMYTATADLEWLHSEGVDMLSTRFWDLADRACREIDAVLKNTFTSARPTIIADQKLNTEMKTSFFRKICIANSNTADVGIAELIQYPFEKHHSLSCNVGRRSRSGTLTGEESRLKIISTDPERHPSSPRPLSNMHSTSHHELSVETVHVFKAQPHLAPLVTIHLSSVNSFCYSMAHKVEAEVGNNLFTMFVLLCESLGSIEGNENLIDVFARLNE
ncbi:hypothetical protein CCR75_004440 [Bremia lactucae]|uniref:Uncharacterized protein n=1 Tax=Bremia lactucae TaxID=4779 RepID=A0A976IIG9_BRELC|nr:hypothetical protein CCR75_004440 [Bremia lactucae]